MKAEIAWMRAHGGGCIVNMAYGVGAHRPAPGTGACATAKARVSALTRTAAREYIGGVIRINAISPGPVDAPGSRRPCESGTQRDQRIAATVPIGCAVALHEAANAAAAGLPGGGFAGQQLSGPGRAGIVLAGAIVTVLAIRALPPGEAVPATAFPARPDLQYDGLTWSFS